MKRNFKIIIGMTLGIIVVGGATVLLLNKFMPRDSLNSTASIPSSEEIIKALKEPASVAALHELYTESKTPITGLNDLNYTKENSYTIYEPGTHSVQFEQKDTEKTDNATVVKSAVEQFLTSKGLKKIVDPDAVAAVFTIFDSEQTTCQLLELPKMNTRAASLSISCVKKSTLTEKYASIDALLALYDKTGSTPLNIKTVRIATVTEDNKKLSTLDTYGLNDSALTLLFAAIDDNWEYIGQRPLSTGTTETNTTAIDRSISGELAAKIADPKYQGFLAKYIK